MLINVCGESEMAEFVVVSTESDSSPSTERYLLRHKVKSIPTHLAYLDLNLELRLEPHTGNPASLTLTWLATGVNV